jgi:hypothetical protein
MIRTSAGPDTSITVISCPALKIGEAGINTTVSNVEHNSHRLGHNG